MEEFNNILVKIFLHFSNETLVLSLPTQRSMISEMRPFRSFRQRQTTKLKRGYQRAKRKLNLSPRCVKNKSFANEIRFRNFFKEFYEDDIAQRPSLARNSALSEKSFSDSGYRHRFTRAISDNFNLKRVRESDGVRVSEGERGRERMGAQTIIS